MNHIEAAWQLPDEAAQQRNEPDKVGASYDVRRPCRLSRLLGGLDEMPEYVEATAEHGKARGHAVIRGKAATRVTFRARPQWRVEITGPDEVLEWFIAVKREGSGGECYTYSSDHYATGEETQDRLAQELSETVIKFIDVVSRGELRVEKSEGVKLLGKRLVRSRRLEVRLDSSRWRDVWSYL
jgi:hypothetical protein